ncbi:MAG: cardiolipin synthase [Streptococcaceae bacterium]|jgi:cardiolipin synthase|nr:cardiolipin synthase [Streptococcaceae bacterium]
MLAYEITLLVFQIIFSAFIIFRERKSTSSTWAWLFIVNILPIVGFVLYLLIGRGIAHRKIFRLRDEMRPNYERELAVTEALEHEPDLLTSITDNHVMGQLIHLLFHEERSLISVNTGVEILTDGAVKFDRLIADIEKAHHHVHLEYYIWKNDEVGLRLLQALVAAAKRGVEVRLLIDAWGSRMTKVKEFHELLDAGGFVAQFFPSIFPDFLPTINPRFNYRLHRKIVVIDGLVGYTGGFNVGDEYVHTTKKFGYWRDTHLRLTGDVVYSLQTRFIMDWNSQHHDEITKLAQVYYPVVEETGSDVVTQFVTSGPDEKKQQVKLAYLKMINGAEREIIIQTPYYIPDTTIHDALKLALMSGVKVKIMIPNKPDHPFVYWATYYYTASLIRHGAEAYTYENGFIHSKMIVVDGEVTSIGSTNFDNRSFQLDFEGNLMIYDEKLSRRFREDFFEDLKVSKALTRERYQERSYWIRFKEGLARLISPLL